MRLMTVICLVLTLFAAQTALAAPGLLITKPPVGPVSSWTGPVIDQHAEQGQWFLNTRTTNPLEEVRPYEFYDNVIGNGGGFASFSAIKGVVNNVNRDTTNGNILSFDIFASITNDMPATSPWADGQNSHNEYLHTLEQYAGIMQNVKLTTEFAISGLNNLPLGWVGPYKQGEAGLYNPPVYVIAQDYDQLAWYCWTPGNNEPGKQPSGGYYVPTYDFPDILPGQTVTRTLHFSTTGAGIAQALDLRFNKIMESYNSGLDIFLNRTTDLKIGDWLDTLDIDNGQPYWSQQELVQRAGNVSVFFVPEPGTIVMLAIAAFMVLAGYRKIK